jgi:DNA-binding IclR family transcriptional regulator
MSDIQSVRRAFDILRAVSAKTDGVALSFVAAEVSLPKSTVSRMLSTLVRLGMVERVNGREGFRIGSELIGLTTNTSYTANLSALARPYLQKLSQATNETLTLCIPDGDSALYIDQINTPRALQVHDWRGQKLPLHASSDGKLYLAFRTEPEITRYLRQPLQRFTNRTITGITALRKELSAIRKKGYAWTHGEIDEDLAGVAAPIHDLDGNVIASVCVFGPIFRWPIESKAGGLIRMTKETAQQINERLQRATKFSMSR